MVNLQGQWTGEILGTNTGKLFLEIQQINNRFRGVLRVSDDRFGLSIFNCIGDVTGNNVHARIEPTYAQQGIAVSSGELTGGIDAGGSIGGEWRMDLGTAGTFRLDRAPIPGLSGGKKIFVVHGHDDGATQSTARLLERLELEAVLLGERPAKARTLIEKFEAHTDVDFAVVILTADDLGSAKDAVQSLRPRARQNVILELGYFIGRLTRDRVVALYDEGVEMPSDIIGIEYILLDNQKAWQIELAKAIKHSGIDVDLNKIVS